MADNFVSNPGTGGSTFAADELSGVLYPRTKIVIGADGSNDGDVSSANPLPVTVDVADLAGLATSAKQDTIIGHVDGLETLIGTTNTTLSSVKTAVELIDNAISGTEMQVDVVAALPTGGNFIGQVANAQTLTSGSTAYVLISAASTNATVVKASQGCVTTITATNVHATDIRYLKLYNKATAPTVGTDTPVQVYALAPLGGGVAITFLDGLQFSLGICFALTTGIAHTDVAAIGANDVAVSLSYR